MLKRFGRPRSSFTAILLLCLLVIGTTGLAHLPRLITEDRVVEVKNPENSQAFYGQLTGSKDIYEIHADAGFLLYVSLLVPDLPDISTDISARIIQVKSDTTEILSFLEGENHHWENFYEPFAGDRYLEGPEFEKRVPAGLYRIEIFNPSLTGKYVLSVGKQEVFTMSEMLHTIRTLPALKRDFFEKSPLTAYLNLMGLFMLIAAVLLAVPLYFAIRLVFRKTQQR